MAITLADALVFIAGDDSELASTLTGAKEKVGAWASDIGEKAQAAVGAALKVAAVAATAALVAATAAAAAGVHQNALFERFQTQFEVFLGSAEAAQQRIRELVQFGATTPFDLPGVIEADRILQGFGLHAVDAKNRFGFAGEEIRRIAGDVASGTGASFESIATYIGRFSKGSVGEAMQRFQELGIVTRDELAAMGVEFSRSGELLSPLGEATEALLQLMQDKFGGMMEAQSATFEGMLSNLRDWVDGALREVSRPIFDKLKEGLVGLLDLLNSQAVQSALTGFGTLLEEIIGLASDLTSGFDLFGKLQQGVERLNSAIQQAVGFVRQLRDELAGLSAADVMSSAGAAVEEVNTRLAVSLANLEQRHAGTIAGIEEQIAGVGAAMGKALADIEGKYADKAADLGQKLAEVHEQFNESLAKANQTLSDRLAANQKSLQERLESLAEVSAQRREAIEQSIAQKQTEFARTVADKVWQYEQKLAGLRERLEGQKADTHKQYADQRAQLQARLLDNISDEESAFLESQIAALDDEEAAQIAALEDEEKREEEKLKAQHDHELEMLKARQREQLQILKNRLKEEEEAYQKAEAQERQRAAERQTELQREHERAVAELEQRLTKEKGAVQKQQGELASGRAAEAEAIRAQYGSQLAALQERLAAEQQAYRDQRAQLETDAAAEQERIMAEAEERAAAIGTGPAARLANTIQDVKEKIGGIVGKIKEWLGETFTLQDALIALGGTIAIALVPALVTIVSAAWPVVAIFALIMGAAALLRTAWENDFLGIRTLFERVWNEGLKPAFDELREIMAEKLPPIIEKLRAIWEEDLQPALERLGLTLEGDLIPLIGDFLIAAIEDAVEFVGWLLDQVDLIIPVIEGWAEALGWVIEQVSELIRWIKDLAAGLADVELPDWMTPGSATPWETGLRGVNQAMKELSRGGLPQLSAGLDFNLPDRPTFPAAGQLALAGAGAGGQRVGTWIENLTVQFTGPAPATEAEGRAAAWGIKQALRGR